MAKDKDGTIYLGTLGDLGYLVKDSLGANQISVITPHGTKRESELF
jgi:hypothetical protein